MRNVFGLLKITGVVANELALFGAIHGRVNGIAINMRRDDVAKRMILSCANDSVRIGCVSVAPFAQTSVCVCVCFLCCLADVIMRPV